MFVGEPRDAGHLIPPPLEERSASALNRACCSSFISLSVRPRASFAQRRELPALG